VKLVSSQLLAVLKRHKEILNSADYNRYYLWQPMPPAKYPGFAATFQWPDGVATPLYICNK
jgi:hypothetical protein